MGITGGNLRELPAQTLRNTRQFQDPLAVAEAIIDSVGPNLVMALPLGLGKANHIVNALFAKVEKDPALSLTILTALTLEKPAFENDLHRRFLEPVSERLFGAYPALRYARPAREGKLPDNIRVEEFFFLAGSQLNSPISQQNHICANYTHALNYILARGVNVLAQLVAENAANSRAEQYNASCNADLTGDMLAARKAGKAEFLFAGEVNEQLPFMAGDAILNRDEFDIILSGPDCQFPLFSPPRLPVTLIEYAAALHVARIIPDGGTLQIGIGSLGDAVSHCLVLRHRQNERFRQLISTLSVGEPTPPFNELAPFDTGLHGLSEMLVEGFIYLFDQGVLRREVDGKVVNAAFFLGSVDFYKRLREMDKSTREKFAMRSIYFTNEVFSGAESKRISRANARFVNKAMMVTLRGEIISDGLEDGRVVSGVGGQFDFAVQAFALDGARSVIVVPATRRSNGKTVSNILWNYGNTTVPRHLRDIVVTEYGIADLRGKTDAQVIAAMLSVTDSRFQRELLEQARASGKISGDYKIPQRYSHNTPGRVKASLEEAADTFLPEFPLGSEFTDIEQQLLGILSLIRERAHSPRQLAQLIFRGLLGSGGSGTEGLLARMDLERPRKFRHKLMRLLLIGGHLELNGE